MTLKFPARGKMSVIEIYRQFEMIGLREGTDENLSESRQNPLRFD